jgi:uncharacterized membrane protein YkoI
MGTIHAMPLLTQPVFPAFRVLALAATLLCGTLASAQPADRQQAFTSAIAAAEIAAATFGSMPTFIEAKLDRDDETWVFEIEYTFPDANQFTEVTINATSFATISTELRPTSVTQRPKLLDILSLAPGAAISVPQAVAIAVQRTPDATSLFRIGRDIQSSSLFFEARYLPLNSDDDDREQRIRISPQTGAPTTDGGVVVPPSNAITLQQAAANVGGISTGVVLEVELEDGGRQFEVKVLDGVTALEPLGVLRKFDITAVGGNIAAERIEVRSSEAKAEDALTRLALLRLNATPNVLIPNVIAAALVVAPGATPVKLEYEFEKATLLAKVVVIDAAALRVIRINPATLAPFVPPFVPPLVPGTDVTIDPAQAGQIAANSVPSSFVLEIERELEAGRPLYEVKLIQPGTPRRLFKVIVDARTSRIWGSAQLPMSTSFLARVNSLINRRSINPGLTPAQAISACRIAVANGVVESIELAPSGPSRVGYNVRLQAGEKIFDVRVNDDGSVLLR